VFHKILIANRGEIALRVLRTCREMGIRAVIAHSTADSGSLPVRLADESICIGPPEPRQSYLNIPSIISAAAITDSEAIHPGYGMLAENPTFAEVCRACGITFIGPSPEAIRLMGDKAQARAMAEQAGAPVVPGSEGPLNGVDEAQALADDVGYPVMVKAAAGGGGRGMRIVREREGLARAYATCQSEAQAAFGSSVLYLEKFVDEARHVEVQLLGDRNGIRVHLGERDCSVQRRHQKLVEESPAPAISRDTRAGLCKAALAVANAVKHAMPPGDLRDLFTDGAIAGVGSVLTFLPQILILFWRGRTCVRRAQANGFPCQHQFNAAVLLSAFRGVIGGYRRRLAQAAGGDGAVRNPLLDQIIT